MADLLSSSESAKPKAEDAKDADVKTKDAKMTDSCAKKSDDADIKAAKVEDVKTAKGSECVDVKKGKIPTGDPAFGNLSFEVRSRSVVKIHVTSKSPNYAVPWALCDQHHYVGSGWVLPGRRFCTVAHLVMNARLVEIQKHGEAEKVPAKVLYVSHETDIAILELATTAEKTEAFWSNRVVLPFVELPAQQAKVSVLGFPTLDSNLCVTVGVMSRCTMQTYAHGRTSLLALQVEATINPGNSGGPAFNGPGICGMVFQTNAGIGFLVPAAIIKLVLNDIEKNQKVTALCRLNDLSFSESENPGLRRFLRLDPPPNNPNPTDTPDTKTTESTDFTESVASVDAKSVASSSDCVDAVDSKTTESILAMRNDSVVDVVAAKKGSECGDSKVGVVKSGAVHGVYIMTVGVLSLAWGVLEARDVLVAVDGSLVGDDGTVELRPGAASSERVLFTHLVCMKAPGDVCTFTVLRGGKQQEVAMVCRSAVESMVPTSEALNKPPRYIVWGGFVFTKCSTPFLTHEFGAAWSGMSVPIWELVNNRKKRLTIDTEGVILSQILPHATTIGYTRGYANRVVSKVDGLPLKNLDQLAQCITKHVNDGKTNPDDFLLLGIDGDAVLVIDVNASHAAHPTILADNKIPVFASPDLLPLLTFT